MPTLTTTTRTRWLLGVAVLGAGLAAGAALLAAGSNGAVPDGWTAHGLGDGGQIALPQAWELVTGGASPGTDDPCASTAPGVVVRESSLVDRCGPDASVPTRTVVTTNRPGVPATALSDAQRVEVAGQAALRLEDPPFGPDRERVPGAAYVVPSLGLHLLVRDEVPADVAGQLPDTLHLDAGPDDEVVWFVSDTGGRDTALADPDPGLWVVDAEARAYPLVEELEVPLERAIPWPAAAPDQVAHAWIGEDRLRAVIGGHDRDTAVLVEEDDVTSATFTDNGSTLVWLGATPPQPASGEPSGAEAPSGETSGADASGTAATDGGGEATQPVTVGLARWGHSESLAAGEEPRIEEHTVHGLPVAVDLDDVLLEIDSSGGATTLRVITTSAGVVHPPHELELEHDEADRRLPADARFEERGSS